MAADLPLAFIVGAPRSGSTWLHNMVLAHAACCGPQETHLAASYLSPVREAFLAYERRHVQPFLEAVSADRSPPDRLVGLPALMSLHDFDRWLRAALEDVVQTCLAAFPAARIVVEKSPTNSLFVPLLMELAPECKIVHVVRDPLEVVRSLLEVSRIWGRSWAPANARAAAEMWLAYCVGALEGQSHHSYLEVRYERLCSQPELEMSRVFDFLGVSTDREGVRAAVAAATRGSSEPAGRYALRRDIVDALKGRTYLPEPAGFRRESRSVQVTLKGARLATVIDVVAPLATTLGYAVTGWPRASLMARVRARLHARGRLAAHFVGRWIMRQRLVRALRDGR